MTLKMGYRCAEEVAFSVANAGLSAGAGMIYTQRGLEMFFEKINKDCMKNCSKK